MKTIKSLLLIMAFSGAVIAQDSDPFFQGNPASYNPLPSEALFDLLFINNISAPGSTNNGALTGVMFLNGEYWYSRWNTDQLFRVDENNLLIEEFTIPGITGTRTFSTDGTNVYIANATNQIFVVNPIDKTLIDVIDVLSSALVRMLIYDENLNSNNGGFWIGSFENRIIAAVDMQGNELFNFTGSVHGTRPYDGIVDYVSEGGPYLLIHEFGPSPGFRDFITQIRIEDGTPTGIEYNFEDDAPSGFSNIQAGGLFLTDEIGTDQLTILGVSQSSPGNLMFALELDEPQTIGVEEISLSEIALAPNPSDGSVVRLTGFDGKLEAEIFDSLGRMIKHLEKVNNNEIDLNGMGSGLYMIRLKSGEQNVTKKLIINLR